MTGTVDVTTGALVARRPVGAYHALSIAAPAIAANAAPGQFVSVGVDAADTVLRRPFAIAGVDTGAGTIELVMAVVGAGTAWLASRPVSTPLDIVGPLGTSFVPPERPARCLLVGGGYGVAPLAWSASRLAAGGNAVELLNGARTASVLYPVAPRPGQVTIHEVTQDGSRGATGLVTDALRARLADHPGQHDGTPTVVHACGPMPMLVAVAGVCAAHDVACQVAVEEHMGCSIGVCMTCVVPTVAGNVRSCIDGPVLDAARIEWTSVLGRRSGPTARATSTNRGDHAGSGRP
ncbi:MAG TPA: dihydroorotate dehydrogenase electron transfer subunit [Euzebyales bacterium]